jgi:outer membrane protein, heavy metal efflux system
MAATDMRALATMAIASLLGGCLSSGSGYDEARSAVRDRVQLEVADPDRDAGDALRASLLSRPLTAEGAARLALMNDANVALALSGVGVGRASLLDALRLPNPHAELEARFHDGDVGIELGAAIDIVPFLLLPARESAATDLLEATSLEAASTLIGVAEAAKVAFYEYQAASQILELWRTASYASAQSSELAERMRAAGNAPELDALNERALHEETRLAVARAEVAATAARERVNAALGLFGEEGAAWTASDRLGAPRAVDLSRVERDAIARSLDLAALGKRHDAASTEVDTAWARGFLPSIEVGASAEKEAEGWAVGPQVGLGVPLFHQGQADVAAAEARMTWARSARAVTARRIRAVARTLGTRLENARESADFYRDTLLPLRERITSETLRKYNAMDAGPFQLLQAKRDQIEAARAYVEVLRDYWIVHTQVETLRAGRLPDAAGDPAAPAAPSARPRAGHD